MIFRLYNKFNLSKESFRLKKQLQCRASLARYPLCSTEIVLNNYLKDKYKIELKTLCLKIINNLNFSFDNADNIVATVSNYQLDKLATLITYGNESVQGSKILRYILS